MVILTSLTSRKIRISIVFVFSFVLFSEELIYMSVLVEVVKVMRLGTLSTRLTTTAVTITT
jgi:hypothetical protein